jgi:hypothetical protein
VKISLTYLDNDHYRISPANAGRLVRSLGRKLPRHGFEMAVEYDGRLWWLARTQHQGRLVWAIRPA